MHAEMQNLFIEIHILYQAQGKNVNVLEMLPELERHGYKIGEREVKNALERLYQSNFLTNHGEEYSMTGLGISEFKGIQDRLQDLSNEVLSTSENSA